MLVIWFFLLIPSLKLWFYGMYNNHIFGLFTFVSCLWNKSKCLVFTIYCSGSKVNSRCIVMWTSESWTLLCLILFTRLVWFGTLSSPEQEVLQHVSTVPGQWQESKHPGLKDACCRVMIFFFSPFLQFTKRRLGDHDWKWCLPVKELLGNLGFPMTDSRKMGRSNTSLHFCLPFYRWNRSWSWSARRKEPGGIPRVWGERCWERGTAEDEAAYSLRHDLWLCLPQRYCEVIPFLHYSTWNSLAGAGDVWPGKSSPAIGILQVL